MLMIGIVIRWCRIYGILMVKKLKIGDIVEIATSKGLCYAHYTHQHPTYGSVIRVFGEFYEHRPSNTSSLIHGEPKFTCLFLLRNSIKNGDFTIVGNEDLTENLRIFPIFRAGMASPATGKVEKWWFWDGDKEWKVGELTEEQWNMPIRGVWNDIMLLDRIESGWTPANQRR